MDGTLRVVVFGDFLPRRILGRFYAACAYLRMCWVSLRLVLAPTAFDVIIVDQVSICLPVLRLARPCGIIFYCHYPDYLLVQGRSLLKRLYRAPLDFLEEQTTGLADIIFVNSHFTAGVFADAFPSLHNRGVVPDVLYPALDLPAQDRAASESGTVDITAIGDGSGQLLLSINRFERKKNIGLAVRAFAALPQSLRQRSKLALAGGYDAKLPENVEHAEELRALAEELGVAEQVVQLRSVSNSQKAALLRRASCLLYTPDREHFGIVPIEAMYARVPVIAVNSGGPLESIEDGQTGYLRPPEPAAWAEVIAKLLEDEGMQARMGEAGRERVRERFSSQVFGRALDAAARRCGTGAS